MTNMLYNLFVPFIGVSILRLLHFPNVYLWTIYIILNIMFWTMDYYFGGLRNDLRRLIKKVSR